MNTQHTPGPWYTLSKPSDNQGLVCSQLTGENIAVTYKVENAHVVAASLDLLEALEDLLEMSTDDFHEGHTSRTTENARKFERARAAIQKAKGE